jgi:cellulose synthase/poly-beta-1,6-N-acetylglucosamine synthase-like glycosyltransferase
MAARTFLRPLGRTTIGGSAGLHGNGMAFRPSVLERRGWSDHLTEDVELHLDLLLDGILVAFAPTARLAAEMPTTLESARTQHERWERGRLQVARDYVPRLFRRVIDRGSTGRVAAADALLDQLVPPLSVLVAGTASWGGLTVLSTLLAPRRGWHRLGLVGAVVAVQGAHVLSALRMVGAPAAVYRSLLGAPRFVVWKLALWCRVLVRPTGVAWIRTSRN